MRLPLLALLFVLTLPPATASPNQCETIGSTNVCVWSGGYVFDEDCAQSWAGVWVFTPQGHRGVWLDNGCYQGSSEWGPYEGSFVGANYDDGQNGDGFRRIHLNTGSGATPMGEEPYCHVGIFNERFEYTRLADCPPVARVPSVLPVVLGLLP